MRKLKWIFLLLGIVLLAYVIRRTGLENILEGIRALGWRLLVVIAVTTIGYLFFTIAWKQLLTRFKNTIHFWGLFRIKISGEAANTLTPLNFAGGDPVRVYLLKKDFPITEGAASVVIDRTIHILAVIMIIITGVWAAFINLDLSFRLRLGLVITITILTILLIALFSVQRKTGFFQTLSRILSFLRIKRSYSERAIRGIETLDHNIRSFYREHKIRFIICVILHYLGRWVGVLEIILIMNFMGSPVNLTTALFLTAAMPLINGLFALIPGAFGVMEGTTAAIFYALHYDPACGVTLQIARRLRALFWISLGLIFITTHERGLKELKDIPREEIST